jgi:hypothetical protein
MEALKSLGENEPWRHIMVGREGTVKGWGARDTVLISRKPFSPTDLDRARIALAASSMKAVYLPGMLPDSGDGQEFAALLRSSNPREYERSYPFDISPVNDNRPFFFYTVQPRDIWDFLHRTSQDSADYKINRAVPLLFGLMAISLVATLVILALPPVILGARLPRQKGVPAFLLFFLFIGAGYILIEVALIQKFVLFLGHPTYALTVVIFSLLISSGLGSYFSRQWLKGRSGSLLRVLGLIAVAVGLLGTLTSTILTPLVGLPLAVKVLVTVLLIAPAGFAMGMPFPTGLRMLEEWHKPSLRWAWSLNAASSVLGSVGALICAIYLGLLETLLVGGCLYLAALLVVVLARRPAPSAAVQSVGQAISPAI